MINTVLSIYFNDYPSSNVRGYGRSIYAKQHGINWIDFYFNTYELIDSKKIIKKLTFYHKIRARFKVYRKLRQMNKLINNSVDVVYLINKPDDIILNFLKYKEVVIIYDFDDPLYLDEFSMPKNFLSSLSNYDGISVDNEIEREIVFPNNNSVIAIPGITPVGYNKKEYKSEFNLIWIGTKSTVIYLKKYEQIFFDLLTQFAEFNITFLGLDRIDLDLGFERVNYIPDYSEKDIVDYSSVSDLGFYPIFDNKLGLHRGPHKIHVYLSCGLPVIAKINKLNQEVLHPNFGFLFESINDFKVKMVQILENKPIIENLKEEVKKKYNGEKNNFESTKKLLNFMNEVHQRKNKIDKT